MTSPNTPSQKRVCLGKITGAHGVKGLVKILPYGDDPTLLEKLSPLYTDETGHETLHVTLKNPHGKYYLAEINGINSREQVEDIKCSLFVSRETLPPVDNDGEYYIEDLIGLKAIDTKAEIIGTVQSVQNFGAGNLLEITPLSGESYFVPFQDEYVGTVDLDAQTVTLEETAAAFKMD